MMIWRRRVVAGVCATRNLQSWAHTFTSRRSSSGRPLWHAGQRCGLATFRAAATVGHGTDENVFHTGTRPSPPAASDARPHRRQIHCTRATSYN